MAKRLNLWSPRPDAEAFAALTPNIYIYGLPLITIGRQILTKNDKAALAAADTLIFTSHHAVIHSVAQLPSATLASKTRIAIGQRTASTLTRHDLPAQLTAPPPFNSEALLADPQFQSQASNHVVLVCGVGGRRQLQNHLQGSAKSLHRIECYQRDKANVSPQVMLEFLSRHSIAGVIVSSCEIADQLDAVLTNIGRHHSDDWTFFALSERIGMRLREQTPAAIIVAKAANQEMLNQQIITWWEGQ